MTWCSLSNWWSNLVFYPFSDFDVIANYWDISNEEIVRSHKHLLITCLTRHCIKFIFEPFIVLSHGRMLQRLYKGQQGLVENKEMDVDVCIKSALLGSEILCLKSLFEQGHVSLSSFTYRNMRNIVGIKKFLLCFIW